MAKTQDYCRFFDTELEADEHMRRMNRNVSQGHVTQQFNPYVLVDGPEDNFAVVDISTAIENDFLYRWAI